MVTKSLVKELVFNIVSQAAIENAAVSIEYINEMLFETLKIEPSEVWNKLFAIVLSEFEHNGTFESYDIKTPNGMSTFYWM